MTAALRVYLRAEVSKVKKRWWLADLRIESQKERYRAS